MSALGVTRSVLGSCVYCGEGVRHSGLCPKIKSIEYHTNGTIKRVEFHDSSPWGYPVMAGESTQ